MNNLSIRYLNCIRIVDDNQNVNYLFYNENYLGANGIIDLIQKYRFSNLSKVKESKIKYIDSLGLFSIKKCIQNITESYHFNFIEFFKFGISRGRDWEYMNEIEYQIAKNVKKKFINPKNRKNVTTKQRLHTR